MAEPTLRIVPAPRRDEAPRRTGRRSRAADICLTGRRVGAAEADRIGLASAVVGEDEVENTLQGGPMQALLAVNRGRGRRDQGALLLAASGRTQSEQELAEREAQYRRLRELASLVDEAAR